MTPRYSGFLCLVLMAAAVGCAPTATAPKAADHARALDATRVLAIAREAVSTNDTWVNQAEFEAPMRQPDGSWHVLVWRLPKVPGGHRFIRIDAKGKVIAYSRGA